MNARRNDPCPCGSRKRYKACCGRLDRAPAAAPGAHELIRLAALMEAGRFAELEGAARAVLAADPNCGFAWQLLSVALARQGKDALHALASAAQCLPDDPVAHLNYGNALGRLGRLEEARASFTRALAARAEFPEAHNNLADLFLELGRLEEAAESCRRAIELRPEYAEAHQSLGRALLRLGCYDEAALSCRRAIAIKPQFAEAHSTLGNALLKLARLDEATGSFRRALEIDPGLAETHINLANALRSIGRLDEAVAGYRRALLIKPDFVLAHIELGNALRLQRRTVDAEMCCRNALALDPDSTAALKVLAELRADVGRFAEAEDIFRRVVAIEPDSPEGWTGLARLRRMGAADAAWLTAAQRVVEQGLPPRRELSLRYAMGKYFDDLGDFANAFRNYRRANELAKRDGPPYDRTLMSGIIDLIVRTHDDQWINRARSAVNPSTRPVFIVGMLRSGTSLAEQVLASHPSVFGAGELMFWGRSSGFDLSDAMLARLGEDYLRLLEDLSAESLKVIDKFPTNFLMLGLIHAALPHARIIHMQRNAIDTCLSIYFQHFEAVNSHANDLDDLAHYYREYRRVMQHWRTVLPGDAMLEVPYEGLVFDLPGWTRRMLDFISLPWDARCLDFERTERPVVTASRWQVRQKISTSSVGRWRHYEQFVAHLRPLLELDQLSRP